MTKQDGSIRLTIDNQPVQVKKGITILEAAEQNDIYIPTLCAHKKLSPYGGCRMCLVEVEGARGFLTACTTPVEDGMIVRTHTDQIQRERREILELILSEHTSSCLICDEREACKNSMGTIRKVGVTTGCRYCPNDDRCELEKVVSWLGIKEIPHSIYYRNFRVEKEDPFYDRDYNICILCGRCVRVCQEVRNANVLAFKQRGRNTIIGPAFGRTHLEAGCEFCGACVSICPTGSLAEKSNKWDGVPDREQLTTCALCGVGCQMQLQIKGSRVIGVQPAEDVGINDGQLCVKGRFCINEFVNDYRRLTKPLKKMDGTSIRIQWEEAIDLAAEKLAGCPPDQFGMLISPNCTNEDLYVAQKFVRVVMRSHHIDSTARMFYNAAFNSYLDLMKRSVPLSEVEKATVILAAGLDLRYSRSVIGVKIRKAIARGAKVITINAHDHSLSLGAEVWLKPTPGEEAGMYESLAREVSGRIKREKSAPPISEAARLLRAATRVAILVGPDLIFSDRSNEQLQHLYALAVEIGAGVLPLPAQNNLYGSLLMGTYPELLPGWLLPDDKAKLEKIWKQEIPEGKNDWNALSGKKLSIAYLIGEYALPGRAAGFTIQQNIYSPTDADLILPAAAFTETDGTFTNGEGRMQCVNKAVDPPGEARPDWLILCQIARKMGTKGFDYSDASEIRKEISRFIKGFESLKDQPQPVPENVRLTDVKRTKRGAIATRTEGEIASAIEHVYRGIPISDRVEGFRRLMSSTR